MTKLIWFTKEEELQKLTGLKHEEFYDNGFNLDDWDFGIMSETRLVEETDSDDEDACFGAYPIGETHYLLDWMGNWCAGMTETEYKGQWYYMCYHA